MESNMKAKYISLSVILIILCSAITGFAVINRQYEYMIVTGDTLTSFSQSSLSHLYLYKYDSNTESWDMIPFQFDEANSKKKEMRYFSEPDSMQKKLDDDDELVFMVDDLGDQADSSTWMEGMDSTRYEIELVDPLTGESGYLYLYRSDDSTLMVPNSYEMVYDSLNDRIETTNYTIQFGRDESDHTGQMSGVYIKNGSGVDIFDRIKIRAFGMFLFWRIDLNENTINAKNAYAKVGPVRIIRNMDGEFKLNLLDLKEAFTQTLFFYPWSGAFRIADIPIGEVTKIGAQVYTIRVSWDMNENATGMKFYSEYNPDGILIDAAEDVFNPTVNPGELNWSMATGDQGTLVNVFNVPNFGDYKKLYYFDYPSGDKTGHREEDYDKDTGDMKSYGDNGFILEDDLEDYIDEDTNLDIVYYNFFLPANCIYDEASQLAENLKNPLELFTRVQKYVAPVTQVAASDHLVPDDFQLFQNYPNPFNPYTTISFNISTDLHVKLSIYSAHGSLVTDLVDASLAKGYHSYRWDGRDSYGNSVPTGLYLGKLTSGVNSATIKIMLIK